MILPYLATALLVVVTAYSAIASFRRQPEDGSSNWIFPGLSQRFAKISVGVCTLALFLGATVWLTIEARHTVRRSSRFLVPEGYIGWVRVEFQVKDAPPLPVEDGDYLFKVPASGVLRTSSPEDFGWAKDRFFYCSEKGTRVSLQTGAKSDAFIWGKINGEESTSEGKRKYEEFFVGTRQQFADQTREQHHFSHDAPAK